MYFHSEFVSEICRLINDAVQYVAHRIKFKAYRLVKVGVNFYWTTNSNTRFPHLFHYSLQFHIIWWSTRRKNARLRWFQCPARLGHLVVLYYYKLAIIWMFKRMKNDMFLQKTEGTSEGDHNHNWNYCIEWNLLPFCCFNSTRQKTAICFYFSLIFSPTKSAWTATTWCDWSMAWYVRF